MSGVRSSQAGRPPKSHSAQAYGPGLTMTHSPARWAVRMKAARSLPPERSQRPGSGSRAFQKTYVPTVLRPAALIFMSRSAQYSRGMRW